MEMKEKYQVPEIEVLENELICAIAAGTSLGPDADDPNVDGNWAEKGLLFQAISERLLQYVAAVFFLCMCGTRMPQKKTAWRIFSMQFFTRSRQITLSLPELWTW